MNEPSNFLTGTLLQCPTNRWDDPPYGTSIIQNLENKFLNDKFVDNNWIGLKVAAHVGATGRLSEKTICMASNFGENDEFLHYEVHSLYGYSHAMATQRYAV